MPRSASAQPKLPRFSPTRIGLYLFCPRAYHFYYRQALRWGRMNAGQALGGSLHRSLQMLHERGGPDSVPLEELIEHLRAGWLEVGFETPEQAQAFQAVGESALRRHYEAPREPGRVTLWTERTVQHRYPDFVLFGKVDRLDRRADGSLEVVDYKSGRLTVTEEEVRESLALRIYQLLVARENPGTPVHTGILCLRSGDSATVLRSPEELDEVEAEVSQVVRTLLADERMAALPGEQCRECLYPRVCPPGRNWLAKHPLPSTAEGI